MTALMPGAALLPDNLIPETQQPETQQPETQQHTSSIHRDQAMKNRHTCLCCAHPLLRHIRIGKLYWHCHHCYQAMPAMPAISYD